MRIPWKVLAVTTNTDKRWTCSFTLAPRQAELIRARDTIWDVRANAVIATQPKGGSEGCFISAPRPAAGSDANANDRSEGSIDAAASGRKPPFDL